LNGNTQGTEQDIHEIGSYPGEYFYSIGIPVPQFQVNEMEIHHVRWTGAKEFRKTGEARADWVWVRLRARSDEGNGTLGGRTIGIVQGLFRVWDGMQRVHEVALVKLLRVKGSRRPHSKEGMIRMEWMEGSRGIHFIRTTDMEGMAHLIPLEKDKVWLVNNRIDFITWNELYE
jgi:hypothetical protein